MLIAPPSEKKHDILTAENGLVLSTETSVQLVTYINKCLNMGATGNVKASDLSEILSGSLPSFSEGQSLLIPVDSVSHLCERLRVSLGCWGAVHVKWGRLPPLSGAQIASLIESELDNRQVKELTPAPG